MPSITLRRENLNFACQSTIVIACALTALALSSRAASAADDRYCIVVSKATAADAAWKPVVAALREKHHGEVLAYEKSLDETRGALRRAMPRYVCFVARPDEAGREFVANAHRLLRRLDDGPYTERLLGHSYRLRCRERLANRPPERAASHSSRGRRHGNRAADLRRGPLVLRAQPGQDGPQAARRQAQAGAGARRHDEGHGRYAQRLPPAVVRHLRPCLRAQLDAGLPLSQRAVPLPGRTALRTRYSRAPLRRPQRQCEGLPARGQLPDGPHRRPRRDGPGLHEVGRRVPDDRLHGALMVRLRRLGHAGLFRRAAGPFHAGRGVPGQSGGAGAPAGDLFSGHGKGQARERFPAEWPKRPE